MKTFGQNLKCIRESLGLSQFQLSKLVGTTQQRVSEWERDLSIPTLNYLIKLVRVLDAPFEELTDGIEV